MLNFTEQQTIFLNERQFNNLCFILKDEKEKVILVNKDSNDSETTYEVFIKDPLAVLKISLEKNKCYEERIEMFANLEENLFV